MDTNMLQTVPELNLARKLRPQTFSEIVGQELSIQLLKNSLAQNKFFPVYLLAGTRGCGKTSSARVFAAAVNCEQLPAFQKDPVITIPCTQCISCVATRAGNHPDFIEIDAASNTGVDNVRSILETCSYLPLMGRKKIYLIDEAHMLSKSAFNAFLKMLEEPPASVIFMLATTEALKIPDTVRSRCFQLSFKALAPEAMKNYVSAVCAQEAISIDQAALDVLMHEVDGCMRDALNLLEQVRFLGREVDERTILTTLGLISRQQLYELFSLILAHKPVELLVHLELMKFTTLSASLIWNNLLQLCRSLLWKKYGTQPSLSFVGNDAAALDDLVAACSFERLQEIMHALWTQEEFFLKTTQKHLFLEYLLLKLADASIVRAEKPVVHRAGKEVMHHESMHKKSMVHEAEQKLAPVQSKSAVNKAVIYPTEEQVLMVKPPVTAVPTVQNESFVQLVEQIGTLGDRLLAAIFTQAQFLGIDAERRFLRLGLTTVSSFYQDKVRETQALWQPILFKIFPGCNDFVLESLEKSGSSGGGGRQRSAAQARSSSPFTGLSGQNGGSAGGPDITDKQKWAQANLLTSQFSGKLELIKEETE